MRLSGAAAYVGVIAVLLTAGGVVAHADSVEVKADFSAGSAGQNVNIWSPTDTNAGTFAGIYNFTLDDITPTGPNSSPLSLATVRTALGPNGSIFHGVCIDLTHNIGFTQANVVWSVAALPSVTNNGVGITQQQANAIGYIWKNHYTATPTADIGAAFQLAIWDILYGQSTNGAGLGSAANGITGLVPASYFGATDPNGDFTTAKLWVAQAALPANQSDNTLSSNMYALVSYNSVQDFNIAIFAAPVPLPGAAVVGFSMLSGFGGLFAIRKRLRNRKRIAE